MKLSKLIFPALAALSPVAKKTTSAGISLVNSVHLPIHGDFFNSAQNFAEIIPQQSKHSIWGPLPETYQTFKHRLKVGTPTPLLPEAEQLHKQETERKFVSQQRAQANQYIDKHGYEKYLQGCESVAYYVREMLKPPEQKERFEAVVHELASPFNATLHRSKNVAPAIPVEAKRLLDIPISKRSLQQEKRIEELGFEMIHPHGFSASASSREEKANGFMEDVKGFKLSKYVLKPDPKHPPVAFSRDACPLPELHWGVKKRFSRLWPSFGEYGDPPSLIDYEVGKESELILAPRFNKYKPTEVTILNDGTSVVTMMVSGKSS